MPLELLARVPAKVNLALDVGSLQPDGYHEVTTVLQTVSLYDRLHVRSADDLGFSCSAPGVAPGPGNLAMAAAIRLREASGCAAGARITLVKRIPVAAGLGGGSADAAAALVACAHLWNLQWPVARLVPIAASLGADVPFFLTGGTALASGRGDVVVSLPALPSWAAVLARPESGSATSEAYRLLDQEGDWPRPDVAAVAEIARSAPRRRDRDRLQALASRLGNTFNGLLRQRPDIAAAAAALNARGSLASILAGSGSAVFGLFRTLSASRAAARDLRAGGWWAAAVRFVPCGVQCRTAPRRGPA